MISFKGKKLVVSVIIIMGCILIGFLSVQAMQQMTIATGSLGGTFYPIGSGIANIITNNVDGVNVIAEQSGGARENTYLVNDKKSDFGITNPDIAYYAYNGIENFENKLDIVAVGSLHGSTFQIVTLPGSNVESVEDMKGKPIAIGPAGSGSNNVIKIVLEAYGMSLDDIVPSYLGQSAGVDALKDGRVKAVAVLAGSPTASLLELRATRKFEVVKIGNDILDKIESEQPYFNHITVPSSVYNLDEDYGALLTLNVLITHPSLDDNFIYNVTKAIYENLDVLSEYHVAAKNIKLDDAPKVPIPLHPGAEKYFKEKGLLPQ